MDKLTSFENSGLKGGIEAQLDFAFSKDLTLTFFWNPIWDLKTSGKSGQMPLSRKDKIWESTCFECFLKPRNGTSYWEINLAIDGRWNIYSFDSIRTPQPPREDNLWRVESIETSPGKLKCVVKANCEAGVYQIGFSAIIETSKGEKSFWALKHCKSKPDFHDYGGFIIERDLK